MSDDVNVPPDVYLNCHNKEVIKIVICVVCSERYHKEELNKKLKDGAKYITSTLVICDIHRDLNLKTINDTSNLQSVVSCLKDLYKCKKFKRKIQTGISQN